MRKIDPGVELGPANKYENPDGDSPDPGFAPLVIMVAAVTIGYLAKTAFELWENYKYCGLIVDLRKDPVQVIENTNLARGTLLVVNADGSTKLHTPENESALQQILTQVLAK